jgi:hypothetical protein
VDLHVGFLVGVGAVLGGGARHFVGDAAFDQRVRDPVAERDDRDEDDEGDEQAAEDLHQRVSCAAVCPAGCARGWSTD